VCVDNTDYTASLELHKIYRVLPDRRVEADGDLRVIDESGEDYLYEASSSICSIPPMGTTSTRRW
jgi:hypothetical protein